MSKSAQEIKSAIDVVAEAAKIHSDDRIFEMVAMMEAKPKRSADERAVLVALYQVIESRHDVDAAMDAWAADLNSNLTYGQALAKAVGR